MLGFAAGGVTGALEDRGWLRTGTDASAIEDMCRSCESAPQAESRPATAGSVRILERSDAGVVTRLMSRLRLRTLLVDCVLMGRRIGLYFLAYSALGYLIIEAVPMSQLVGLLGDNPAWAVPVAAALGIPVYVSTEASLPMVAALMRGGLGAGPAMAFLISGAGTSIGAISGALLIARRKVVGLVIALLFCGAVVLGWLATALL
jgi:uncharacterized protein